MLFGSKISRKSATMMLAWLIFELEQWMSLQRYSRSNDTSLSIPQPIDIDQEVLRVRRQGRYFDSTSIYKEEFDEEEFVQEAAEWDFRSFLNDNSSDEDGADETLSRDVRDMPDAKILPGMDPRVSHYCDIDINSVLTPKKNSPLIRLVKVFRPNIQKVAMKEPLVATIFCQDCESIEQSNSADRRRGWTLWK